MRAEVAFRAGLLPTAVPNFVERLHHFCLQTSELMVFVVQLYRQCPWMAGRQPQWRANRQLSHRTPALEEPLAEQVDLTSRAIAEEAQGHMQQLGVEYPKRGSLAGSTSGSSRPLRELPAHILGRIDRHEQSRCRTVSHRLRVGDAFPGEICVHSSKQRPLRGRLHAALAVPLTYQQAADQVHRDGHRPLAHIHPAAGQPY